VRLERTIRDLHGFAAFGMPDRRPWLDHGAWGVRAPLGEVARNLGKADQLAGTVPDRVDDDIGPELRPVLADAPAFLFEFALALGDFKRSSRKLFLAIFLGIKARKMLTEDFGGGVALEPLRAGIPGRDDSRRVQQIDSVVRYSLNKETVTAFFRQ